LIRDAEDDDFANDGAQFRRINSAMLSIRWLGRVTFSDALALQEEIVARKSADASAPDELLLLEHEPVYTIGRTPDQSSLREPATLPHPVVQTNRGGQATYHGPGQLVGYPILDLRVRGKDLHRYLRGLEEVLIALLGDYGVAGERSPGQTGVWVGRKKIASIGVGVRRWISMHGFALNVGADLAPFSAITPCGIIGVEMTSLSRECGREIGVQEVAERLGVLFSMREDNAVPS
jgi:lipoyl(octanoyl) transferase